jgi:starch-binding outer membrane protein, SusD/RagB family
MMDNKLIRATWKFGIFKAQTIRIVLILLMSVIFVSCEDFIDVPPKDAIDAESFLSNSTELVFAVNGVYAQQRGIFGNFNYFNLIEARTDNAGQDQLDQRERVETDTFEETPGNLLLVNVWTQNYVLINNANNVIQRAPEVPFETSAQEQLINRSIGEAKFLRAMSYFILVNMFGEVPLRTQATNDFDNATLPRSPVNEVYSLILSDLNDAVNSLPENYSGGQLNEIGRATRLAAYTLLGKVHLQMGNKSEASAALNNVINRFDLMPNYGDLHAPGNNNLPESIFEVNFNPDNQIGLTMNNLFIPASEAARLGIVAGGFAGRLPTFPTKEVQTIFEEGDLRASASFTTYDNNGNLDQYISKFLDLDAAGNGSNINLIILRYADLLLMKAEADGESAASYELINQVRRRAFGKNPSLPDANIDIDQTDTGTFLEKVMLERRRELVFEGHRLFDLKRLPSSEALNILNDHLSSEYVGVPTVQEYRLIYPIPQTEIDVSNGVVTQNPGYN